MKKLAILSFTLTAVLFSIISQSQTKMNYYDSSWKKVDELLSQKSLPQSALKEVNKLYAKAKNENNQPQLIKALVYQLKISNQIGEQAAPSLIKQIETEIESAETPSKQILQSIAANMYWQYFQHNRHRFYNRTNTTGLDKSDISTWTIDDLHYKIAELYRESLSAENILKELNTDLYSPVLGRAGNTRNLRPTLFDLLAHEALAYFQADEPAITKPSYTFSIKENAAFDPAADFIHHKFQTNDSSSLHYQALLIFRKLISFHLNDSNSDALTDVDLQRLRFVYEKAVMPQKDEVYILALKHIINLYSKQPAATKAGYMLANYYFSRYMKERNDNKGKSDQKYLMKAKQLCDEMIAIAPESEGGKNCYNLRNNILQKTLRIETEKVNIPGQAFRSLVSYRNISKCFVRVITLDKETRETLQGNSYIDEFWPRLVSKTAYQQWEQPLPPTADFEDHAVEIKVDALPIGEYALLLSANKDFSMKENLLAASYFYVSNISYVNNYNSYFVLHRANGRPLQNANIQVWYSRYDYTDRKNKLQKAETLTADNNGFFELKELKKENRNIRLEIKWEKDYLFMDDYDYVYTRYDGYSQSVDKEPYEQQNSLVYFFTDRSIYRPGQTVFFKGIAVTKNFDTRKAQLLTHKNVTIKLKDVNGQVLDSLLLTTNEYGSVNGNFQLPQQVLTGNFTIIAEALNYSNTGFSVEEYKRPRFAVELEAPKHSYRVNDSITVTGTAKAYAGNVIDGANVKYRVFREVRFLFPWVYYRRYLPPATRMEITNGETVTDATGKFSIPFVAVPDPTLDKTLEPIFHYTVQADVTDINGETRSASKQVAIGYKSLVLHIETDARPIPIKDFKSLRISSRNLSNEWQEVATAIHIYAVETPNRLIRERYWKEPDQFLYSEAEYIKIFPFDEYKNEADHRSWKKGTMVFSKEYITKPDDSVSVSNNWKQGLYLVEAIAKDKEGNEVKAISYIELYDPRAKGLPVPSWQWDSAPNATVEPGKESELLSGSSAGDVFLIQTIDKSSSGKSNLNTYQFFTLKNEKKNFRYPITENDRGGFTVTQFFIKQNRVYIKNHHISVPWTNKQLDVKLVTYRNKTEPGSAETWQVQVSGANGEKLAAEMLATMYDASLDQFSTHDWHIPPVWPIHYSPNQWAAGNNFSTGVNYERNYVQPVYKTIDKRYDQLLSVNIYEVLTHLKVSAAPMAGKRDKGAAAETIDGFESEQSKIKVEDTFGYTPPVEETESPATNLQNIRNNFNETAFFFPDLKTNEEGNISFSFTIPEALTQWKFMALAHTPQLAFGLGKALTVTQKQLMLQPNAPRFVRQKDQLAFSAKIVNMSDAVLTGTSKLELLDAATMEPVDILFKNSSPQKEFNVSPGQSTAVEFLLHIPQGFQSGLSYRISATAKSGEGKTLSDGEENVLPVLTNQMLITEALPLHMKGNGTKNYNFNKLKQSGTSKTLQHYALTVEYTANPIWYAVQSLPYLADYPYDCAEQSFNRYYANTLAATIVNSYPQIKTVLEKWQQTSDFNALVSTLQKNEELKSVLLQETPWLLQAKSETEQKKNLAQLFDMIRMSNAARAAFNQVIELQSPNGGFAWFKGGRDDHYITQYILAGIGHLAKLNAFSQAQLTDWSPIISKALAYADIHLLEEYEKLLNNKARLTDNQLTPTIVHYLYMRSFFKDPPVDNVAQSAYKYYLGQAQQHWPSQPQYIQGMIALALYRNADIMVAKKILASLKETAVQHDEMGMYWKHRRGYFWHESPVETQSLLIEAFAEINQDTKSVDEMKTWLLKQKQTQHWANTKATAEAVYALLLHGTDWLNQNAEVLISLGNTQFKTSEVGEAGTGYLKQCINATDIKPEMSKIQVKVQSTANNRKGSPGGGAVYWQYFEDMDKVTAPAETAMPLQLKKQIFIETNSDRGPVLQPVYDNTVLKLGDKLKVRIELRVDRDMEYVHLKDHRPAGSEPVNVLSSYKWQDGLGYYEATKDVSTNFFFSQLNKGTYVFEYPLFATHKGNFSAGVATIQCMYAPEFISHSEGVRVLVN